ncbi:hypothetical protein KJA17_00020 [Patescibacteria group bacterium]|nr:hypothetical protein [Patescibacteria group bacterium]
MFLNNLEGGDDRLSKLKLIPLKLGDHVRVHDKTMASPQEAEVITIYKRISKG